MKPFDHNKFVGYVCEVTPQYVRLQIPSAKLLHSFYFNNTSVNFYRKIKS